MNLTLYKQGIKKVLMYNSFEKLKNKSILILGANGLIGSGIIDVLAYLNSELNYNIKIICSVRNKNKILDRFNSYNNLKIVEQDLLKDFTITEKVDYVINAASNAHPLAFSTDPVGTISANFIGTKNILEYCKSNKVKRMLFISSGEIYGQGSDDIKAFKEDYSGKINSTDFRSCYPIGKLAAESLCASYLEEYGVKTVIARLCHTYGPTQQENDSRASQQFIKNVLNDKDIVLKSPGVQVRSYCYVLDSVTGILRILLDGKSGEAYNVANNASILSIREFAETVAATKNRKVIFDIPSESEKRGYNKVTRSVLDGTKLEKLGWKPIYGYKEGIKETIGVLENVK